MSKKKEKEVTKIEKNTKEKKGKEFIVRLCNKDINGNLKITRALTGIKGIGIRLSKVITRIYCEKYKIKEDIKLSELNEKQLNELEEIIMHLEKQNIPKFLLNRRKGLHIEKETHLVESDLQFAKMQDIERLKRIKSYKGRRHSLKLPVKGQRTKTTHHKKGTTVGVRKKTR